MKCEEFHGEYNQWLNGRTSVPLSAAAQSHMRECDGCVRYAKTIAGIDAALKDLPVIEMPEELLTLPDRFDQQRRPLTRESDLSPVLLRGSILAIPPVIAWFISASLPPPWQAVPQFILVTAGALMFGISSLRPRFTD